MPFIFPPASCADLQAAARTIPPPPSNVPTAGIALYATFVSVITASNIAWWMLRTEPRLAVGRNFMVNVVFSLSIIFSASSIALRWALYDPATNLSAMKCWVSALSVLLGVSVITVAIVLRAYLLYVNILHAGLVRVATASMRRNDDDVSNAVQIELARFEHSWRNVVQGIRASFDRDTWRLSHAAPGAEAPAATNTDTLLRAIAQTSLAISSRGLFLLGLFLMVPALLVIVTVFAVTPIYWDANCAGCIFYFPLALGCIVQSFPTAVVLLWLGYYIYPIRADPYGVKQEIELIILVVPVPYLTVLLLVLTDPNGLAASNVLSWDWFAAVPSLSLVIVWNLWPVFMAYRDSLVHTAVVRGRVTPSSDRTTMTARVFADVAASVLEACKQDAFQTLAESMYTSELVSFINEVVAFEDQYFDRGNDWRAARCKLIVGRYIAAFSPMQINISSALREAVQEDAGKSPPPREVFERAKGEALHMLFGVFARYVADKPTGKPHSRLALLKL